MSHFSRIQTQIIDKRFLLQALLDLGFQFEEGRVQVKGYLGQKAEAQIVIHLTNSNDIGLRLNGEAYEIIADWAGVRGLTQKEFIDRLTQRYAYHATREKLAEQGFNLVEENLQDSGQIRLVLRRMS